MRKFCVYKACMAIFMALPLLGQANDDRASAIRKLMWESGNPAFEATIVPEMWEDEDAVIIAKYQQYDYRKPVMADYISEHDYTHYRIKLNTEAAINVYREFSYPDYKGVFAGIKVIKSNGEESITDLSDAAKVKREINGRKYDYYKVAVPNLEKGDIIDYYICHEIPRYLGGAPVAHFESVVYHLHDVYPIVKQKIVFNIMRKCYINLKSLNEAPEIEQEVGPNGDYYYYLEDEYREAIAAKYYFYANRSLPLVKLRVSFARNIDYLSPLASGFLGEQSIIKSYVGKVEIMEYMRSYQVASENAYGVARIMRRYAKKNLTSTSDSVNIARQAFYFYRNRKVVRFRENYLINGILYNQAEKNTFLFAYSSFLRFLDIDHDIIVTTARNMSSIDDLLFEDELVFLIRIPDGDNYLYASNFYQHASLSSSLPDKVQGNLAFVVDGTKAPEFWYFKETTLPVEKYKRNKTKTVTRLKLDSIAQGKATIMVKQENNSAIKQFLQLALLDYYDIKKEEELRYKFTSTFQGKTHNEKKVEYMQARGLQKQERLEGWVKGRFDFELEDIGGLDVVQTGRFDDEEEFIYQYEASTSEIVKKAGPNYLLSIGKLLGKQTSFEEEDLHREHDIYFTSANVKYNEILMEIPAQYFVDGLDAFNKTVNNQVGEFRSEAVVKEGLLVIKVRQILAHNFEKYNRWNDVLALMNAANDFNQQQLLVRTKPMGQ